MSYEPVNPDDKRIWLLEVAMYESQDALMYVENATKLDYRIRYAEVLLDHFDITPKANTMYGDGWPASTAAISTKPELAQHYRRKDLQVRAWLRDFWWRLTTPHDQWMLQRRRENRRQDRELKRSIRRDLREFRREHPRYRG
ncbi:hypothetical protein AIRMID_65 [Mycobacterium phage Airmid]|nr:hypothetical protein AIRMID_65 [Mycobacterium phage Airmid]AFN37669.1 hypothetical protein ELTIGER69_67 [Mycobacterium phage ElTiger69]